MKVVHLIASFGAGGAELLAKDIAINTGPDVNVEVWAVGLTHDKHFEDKYINELASHNIPCLKLGKIAGRHQITAIRKLRNVLKERQPDILNAHSELVALYGVIASAGLKTIVVQTIHNTVITHPFLEKYVTGPLAKKIVAISGKCRQLILSQITGNQSKVKLIYNGINILKYQQGKRKIEKEVLNIMTVGRLDVQKDHDTLLKAFAILVGKLKIRGAAIPSLNIIGSGILKDKLEELAAKLNIRQYTNFMGVRNDIPELLYKNDLWVMSSKWEGLSIALMEALASGIPVIATDVGSNDELIETGKNGILVQKESPEEMAEALLKVILNPELRKALSINAKQRISDFNISRCTGSYLEMYIDLMKDECINANVKNDKTEISKAIQQAKKSAVKNPL